MRTAYDRQLQLSIYAALPQIQVLGILCAIFSIEIFVCAIVHAFSMSTPTLFVHGGKVNKSLKVWGLKCWITCTLTLLIQKLLITYNAL